MPQFTVPCPRLTTGVEDSADVVQDLADAASKVHSFSDAVFPHAISCLTDKDFQCRQTELMHKACDKWLAILAVNLSSSEVGRNLEGLGELDNHRDEAREIIAAVIGVRSYNTAITRANSVLKFLKAVLNETPQIKEPFQEELVWRYFHELKRSGGATSAASTLSAFRYAKFIMGFSCLDGVVNSRRLKGYSEVLYANERKLQQALILNVQQIRSLHTRLEDCNAESFDRASAGFMLTAIYGCCRASDLSFLDNIKHDHDSHEGFVELFTAVHKTGRSAVKKSILLPILVPAIGITGNNWATTMREVCEQSGLAFDDPILGPLLRPPSQQGPFLCKRGVTTTEIGKLLRGLVGETIDVANPHEPHLSAHSLKATGLAWAARYGMSWPDRAILGSISPIQMRQLQFIREILQWGRSQGLQKLWQPSERAVSVPMLSEASIFLFRPCHLIPPRAKVRSRELTWELKEVHKILPNANPRSQCPTLQRWSFWTRRAVHPRALEVSPAPSQPQVRTWSHPTKREWLLAGQSFQRKALGYRTKNLGCCISVGRIHPAATRPRGPQLVAERSHKIFLKGMQTLREISFVRCASAGSKNVLQPSGKGL